MQDTAIAKFVSLAFGRGPVVSNWLLTLGLALYVFHAGFGVLFLLTWGIGARELVGMLPDVLLWEPLTQRPDIFVLVTAGVLGKALASTIGGQDQCDAYSTVGSRRCQMVTALFGGSYQLSIWLLVPVMVWVIELMKAIRRAYELDLPVGLQGWIGPAPHIDNFWRDVVWPCIALSMSTFEFWLFLLSLLAAGLIAACKARAKKSR
ncbi:hypothetical protein [Breoghania sp.]|uniref:hypothetical protein n=1 Tax=Breoghania sp. TaxID=2065378 RepID=UPI002AA6FAFA|nr:hypothetical protein [Breoghania sp.]